MYYHEFIKERLLDTAHTLIAGTTGSGKSVLLNSVIFTALNAINPVCVFIDLKRVELVRYKNIFNCAMFVTEPEEVNGALDSVIDMMERRYQQMEKVGLVKTTETPVYVFIDELADLINNKGVLPRLVKIGRLGRTAQIHLVCATQDPSRRTLPAQLMQNFTCCVALRCKSSIESRQVIGIAGAEELPQYGQAILWDAKGKKRFEVPMTPEEDIAACCAEHAGSHSAQAALPQTTGEAPVTIYRAPSGRPGLNLAIALARAGYNFVKLVFVVVKVGFIALYRWMTTDRCDYE